jgi:hypothetical protein
MRQAERHGSSPEHLRMQAVQAACGRAAWVPSPDRAGSSSLAPARRVLASLAASLRWRRRSRQSPGFSCPPGRPRLDFQTVGTVS